MKLILLVYFQILSFFTFIYTQTLPSQTSALFSGSGNCATCHQPGLPNTAALLNQNQQDISPVSFWRSTLMGNSAKDPLWQAKVTAEVLANPAYQQIIEDKCTTCHSPMGRTEAHFNGHTFYSFQEMQNDTLALDGVSCTVCHQIKNNNFGNSSSFSGNYIIENDRLIYGPYQNPFAGPMQIFVNYTPFYSNHLQQSDLCGTCHTLFTPTIDNSGNIVGEIPEQTPYLEWKNSHYPAQNIHCQTCHQPNTDEPIIISNRPMWLDAHTPYAKHEFAGGNVFMQKIFKQYRTEIGVTAEAAQLDSTLVRTLRLLQENTAELTSAFQWRNDTLEIKVAVKNLTGHKFPTAYPSRRAWIHLNLKNSNGRSIFESGKWDTANGEIANLDSSYEQHYNQISDSGQVQIYQALMHDVNGDVTYTLLRGAGYIKDNRIPPSGFNSQGPYFDSTAITGVAAADPDFNKTNGTEGSATDTVTYLISNINPVQSHHLAVKLLYQSVTPRFINDLFQYTSPEIEKFKTYYLQADKSPVLIDSLEIVISAVTGINDQSPKFQQGYQLYNNYPNPFNPVTRISFTITESEYVTLEVYNVLGSKVATLVAEALRAGTHSYSWDAASFACGVYYYRLQTASGFEQIKKLVLLK